MQVSQITPKNESITEKVTFENSIFSKWADSPKQYKAQTRDSGVIEQIFFKQLYMMEQDVKADKNLFKKLLA